ncbi:Endonuclease/Exonuclease/phosphatase family protein [Robiginitalea myxolifaciens]|uniref:Endonuclease/Exonuclease/phosphatase family protein n=1 Tax=Robiginitalea myxolifaciens TaxID=400055 RepID=A0A1I6G086_9FLAO|nr:endonuclease/exonuclease/phosphatase family protein [Robiginitalea myxolifaciens]SFR35582.1 Endonuclease/Exonuclease/phosphatase family protein [Robiginitalea myxolifaciens]
MKYTIGFYNLENLFDTQDHPELLDDDFTPDGFKNWTEERYQNKLFKLGRAIAHLGEGSATDLPVLLGMAEVENETVIADLLKSKPLQGKAIDYIHFDSPDERGIDTALCYHPEYFSPDSQEALPVLIYEEDGRRDYTRDILYVSGHMNGERVHVFVNHWPSRRDGDVATAPKRLQAAQTLQGFIEGLRQEEEHPNCILMGDFNDDPFSDSIVYLQQALNLHNPMRRLLSPEQGSAKYKDQWMLFDQILLSHTFLNSESGTHRFDGADIMNPEFLQEWKEPFKGKPFRTYAGRNYLGGYSDHFPVRVTLKYIR